MKLEQIVKEFLTSCTEYESELTGKGLTSEEAMRFIADRFNEVFHAEIICQPNEESEKIDINPFYEQFDLDSVASFIAIMGFQKRSESLISFLENYIENNKDLSRIMFFGCNILSTDFRMYQLANLSDEDKKLIEKQPSLPMIYKMVGSTYSLKQFGSKLRTILTNYEVEELAKKDENLGNFCDKIRERFSRWLYDSYTFNDIDDELCEANIQKVDDFIKDIDTDKTIEIIYNEEKVEEIMNNIYCIDF